MRLAQDGPSAFRCLAVVTSLLICLGLLLTLGTNAAADPRTKTERDLPDWDIAVRTASIMEEVQDRCGSTDEEMMAIKPIILDYCASALDDAKFGDALAKAHDLGCGNECLTEAALSMRRAVEEGINTAQAERIVSKSVLETKQWCQQLGIPLNDKDFATRMKIRFNGYLASQ